MKTNAPKQITWMIAVILGVLGVASVYVPIPVVSDHSFWVVVIGFVLLTLGTMLKDL